MPLSHIVGNVQAKLCIEKMVQSQAVPSTLLFYGPEGVGKSACALMLAELLMGPKSAHKLKARTHPDLHILSPSGKSATHPIENIRKLIMEATLPPYEAPVKVFIIEEAHQMLPSSSNALLKVLEEPFSHSYFILLTSSLDAILPTIASRCRKIPFFPIPQADIEKVVEERWNKSAPEARRIAFLSHGSLAKAKQLTDRPKLPWKEPLMTLLSLDIPRDYPQMSKILVEMEQLFEEDDLSEETHAAPFLNQIDYLFEEMVMWYRDLELLTEGVATEYLYHLDQIEALKLALSGRLVPLESVLDQIAVARLALQRNVRLRTVLEHFLLKV